MTGDFSSANVVNMYGTSFKGNNRAINIITAVYGCKFIGTNSVTLYSSGGTNGAANWCESSNSVYGIIMSNTTAATNCYIRATNIPLLVSSGNTGTAINCRFYGNNNSPGNGISGSITQSGTVYGEIDGIAGAIASPVNPINGTRSLKVYGYDYGTVFVQWIPVDALKPRKVTVKIKCNSSVANNCYIRLGDQLVNATASTTSLNTLTLTYTHHKTDLLPLYICSRVNTTGGDYVQWDDIKIS
jgi:hypothetical protein